MWTVVEWREETFCQIVIRFLVKDSEKHVVFPSERKRLGAKNNCID